MKRFISFLLVLFFFTGISAQTKSLQKSPLLSEASPESVGISPERLARIDRMCEEEVANGNLPGIVSLVARNGKIVLWKAYGMAENQTGRKMERDAIFRIASQSKAITATAVMMLWEEGKFRLDDPSQNIFLNLKTSRYLSHFNTVIPHGPANR